MAVLGGTGDLGRGLARRLALAGSAVVIGSRDAARAQLAAQELADAGSVTGLANADAARAAEVVIVAVPWAGHGDLLAGLRDDLAGRVVVDCVNPLAFDKAGPYPLDVEDRSAAEQAARLLPDSRVVAAFHHISAPLLIKSDQPIDSDVLVVGDHADAKQAAIALAERIPGLRGVDAGPLRLAGTLEAMTAVLLSINRRYKAHAGIRITDV